MTTLLKNASYLKVSHSGQTTGSLLLADLADEENAKQEKKIPVYVPENGSITLPLDEDVLLSYQQGTIRGLEDQGYVTTTLLAEPSLKPEVWVSTDGDDTNPGTEEAPLATIQKALNNLHSNFDFDVKKRIKLKPGTYDEQIIWNVSNIDLWADSAYDRPILDYSGSGPTVLMTNLSDDEAAAFIAAGGATFSTTPASGTFSYTGQNLVDRQLSPDVDFVGFGSYSINSEWRHIRVDGDLQAFQCVGAAPEGETDVALFDINFTEVQFEDGAYFKNSQPGHGNIYFGDEDFVIDNSSFNTLSIASEKGLVGAAGGKRFLVRKDNSVAATEGFLPFSAAMPITEIRDPLYFVGNTVSIEIYTLSGGGDYTAMRNRLIGEDDVYLVGGTWGNESEKRRVLLPEAEGTLHITSGATVYANELRAHGLNKTSSGSFDARNLILDGNVTISDGATNLLTEGTINGNLTVNAPAVVDLTNVVVKGDISGDGDLTMNGGGYTGTNTLSGTFTYNALGTT